jgi:proteasome lid subunit RPN8/RPN11
MAKAAKVKVRVSTHPVVLMEAEVARKIRQHARTSMKAEVCGVLIGHTDHERMVVEACIQGINAAQGGAHVTFTQDTWEHIYKIKDKEYPDHKIVGWYHSHPGFGVFLSEHDLFIQQNFFSNPQQVAWVYDPHTDEEGCFGWVGDKIEKLSSIRIGYSQSIEITGPGASDYEDEEAPPDPGVQVKHGGPSREPAWVRWTSMALGYLAAVVLGVGLGFLLRGRQLAQASQLLGACQQIAEHPVDSCQQILQQYAPSMLAPTFVPATPLAQPAAAGPPAAGGQKSPGPENSPASPPQEKSPAQKGNNGKH